MAVYGAQDNFVPTHGNADGTLLLTYTLGSTAASFTYQGPGVGDPQQGSYSVTFASSLQAGVAASGTIASIGNPGLHIAGEGDFHSGAMTFTPPQGSNAGSLSGNFSSIRATDLGWSADSDTTRPMNARSYTVGEK